MTLTPSNLAMTADRPFTVGSTFSGVGGMDLGLERAGMRLAWAAESDAWSREVLAHHWPTITLYDDVRAVRTDSTTPPQPVDLLCGGFPCQDLSVAAAVQGKRTGLAGERSGLFHEFARIANELAPQWIIVENVVGLLSASNGRDFAVVLSALADLGYSLAWRVLDARYFGVAQRRRRVFIVGHLGTDATPAVRALAIGGEGDLTPRGCSWQVTPTRSQDSTDNARITGALRASGPPGTRTDDFDLAVALTTSQQRNQDDQTWITDHTDSPIRRLTPTECERLMSWPDGWTAPTGQGTYTKEAGRWRLTSGTSDTRRYKACGNGVVANCAEWIARGILTEHNPRTKGH